MLNIEVICRLFATVKCSAEKYLSVLGKKQEKGEGIYFVSHPVGVSGLPNARNRN
jgi:hypothetical protein